MTTNPIDQSIGHLLELLERTSGVEWAIYSLTRWRNLEREWVYNATIGPADPAATTYDGQRVSSGPGPHGSAGHAIADAVAQAAIFIFNHRPEATDGPRAD